jgi:hydrogenase nickel incorporation protein HypB
MCTTCGCGGGDATVEGLAPGAHVHSHRDGTVHAHPHEHGGEHAHVHAGDGHVHADGTVHSHAHDEVHGHDHAPAHGHRHADGTWHSHGPSGEAPLGAAHANGVSARHVVQVEEDILAQNNDYAERNRRWLVDRGIFALNLVSSPGSGKTSLLVRTINMLAGRLQASVIEGDQQTSHDADRVRATGAPAVQINTGKGCHLDARMVGLALQRLHPAEGSLLMIENVGNLVCPAAFDLGEKHKVAILSVTEGDDKPLKYPDMFHAADLLLINKIDLLPYVTFNVDAAIGFAHQVRPGLEVMRVSAQTGEGFDAWLAWLERGATAAKAARDADNSALRRRIAELEGRLGQAG